MQTKSLPLILFATLLAFFAQASVVAGQITFVQSPTRNQQGQQQGLPPDKKKSLSKYGPEDVFPGAREQDDNTPHSSKKNSRQPSGTTASRTASKPSPTPASPAIPTTTPILAVASPTPPPSLLAAATPVAPTATGNRLAQSPANNSAPSSLVPVALGAASLLVLGALIYVVGMLRKKLREGR
jgi:hypothetical protein